MLGWLRYQFARMATPGLGQELALQRRAARMERAELEALQLAKLNRLLAHWRGVDWYARFLAEHGAPARPLASLDELKLLPVVTKEFITEHLADIAAMPTALRAVVGDQMQLTVRPVDRIDPTPAGKHCFVIRLPDADR